MGVRRLRARDVWTRKPLTEIFQTTATRLAPFPEDWLVQPKKESAVVIRGRIWPNLKGGTAAGALVPRRTL